MKELLLKDKSGNWHYNNSNMNYCPAHIESVEIPKGAIKARFYPLDPNDLEFENNKKHWWDADDKTWNYNPDYANAEKYSRVVWQRQAQPEELPYIGDEQSLNDQYAEIEKVREKHSHYKKDVSHLDVLDIYRVTELFKPHSCGAHIAKKALCSGQRGHKDLLTDIQDIIDTAERWKQMIQEDLNDNS